MAHEDQYTLELSSDEEGFGAEEKGAKRKSIKQQELSSPLNNNNPQPPPLSAPSSATTTTQPSPRDLVESRIFTDQDRSSLLPLFRIYFPDDSYKSIRVDPKKTTVEDLWELVSARIGLTRSSCIAFFLWGVSTTSSLELLLYTHQTIEDVIRSWPEFEKRYNQDSHSLFSAKSVDTIKKGFTLNRPQKSKIRVSAFQLESGELPFNFVMRTTMIFPLNQEQQLADSAAIHLLYIQAVSNIIHSNYPCTSVTALKLGGIQLQVNNGNRNPETHRQGYLLAALPTCVPAHLLKQEDDENEWEVELFNSWDTNKNKDSLALKIRYLKLVRQWDHYGATFYQAKYAATESFYKQEFEGRIIIGVNERGIHLIDPRELKILSHPFSELATWGSERNKFWISLKPENQKSKATTFQFRSPQAELIDDAICDWLEEIQANPPEDLEKGEREEDEKREKQRKKKTLLRKSTSKLFGRRE